MKDTKGRPRELCDFYEEALSRKKLAEIGITALIDEATGYQKIRPKRFLRDMADKK